MRAIQPASSGPGLPGKVRVCVDNHHVARQGLASVLDDESALEFVGKAQSGRGAERMAKEFSRQVVWPRVPLGTSARFLVAVPIASGVLLS